VGLGASGAPGWWEITTISVTKVQSEPITAGDVYGPRRSGFVGGSLERPLAVSAGGGRVYVLLLLCGLACRCVWGRMRWCLCLVLCVRVSAGAAAAMGCRYCE
jgi:hypothetical protein